MQKLKLDTGLAMDFTHIDLWVAVAQQVGRVFY